MARNSIISILFSLGLATNVMASDADTEQAMQEIMGIIGDLENHRDAKCHATASRLEDFMYGTPLSHEARYERIELQKQWIRAIWRKAAEQSTGEAESLDKKAINATVNTFLQLRILPNGDMALQGKDLEPVWLTFTDVRQYSSIAYSLRAILAVQQENQLAKLKGYPSLDESAVNALKSAVDLTTLAALKIADERARIEDRYILEAGDLKKAFGQLIAMDTTPPTDDEIQGRYSRAAGADIGTIKKIIEQKIRSYETYNKISAPVFLRNLQVYFARYRWPSDPQKSSALKEAFNQQMVDFSKQLYLGSQNIASLVEHPLIRIDDVNAYANTIIPHRINEYEDAVFYPWLPSEEQIQIASYDMDAFRDSGLHWKYLGAAISTLGDNLTLGPDPFAAELLVENIAQYGVLLLREAGVIAKKADATALDEMHIETALKRLKTRLNNYPASSPVNAMNRQIISAKAGNSSSLGHKFFDDVTSRSGIRFRHSSADWLHRLIRSYTARSKSVAVLAVPPAFGGSGIAAEDINDDGLPDVLMLSGSGNRLYLNRGDGQFKDITEQAGIHWLRKEDGLPAEPRQPIIADFDNDGLPDIFITYVNDSHRLYKNLGDSRFEDVSRKAGLGGTGLVAGPATTADFDNDGLLDIYIGYFGQYTEGINPTLARRNVNGLPNRLFHNRGDFVFEDITEKSYTDNTGWTQALAHTDFDRDGKQDLIVGNDFGINSYYRNLGGGTFQDVAPSLGVDKPSYTMNVGLADLNDDLFPDIYISNIVTMDKDQKYVLPSDTTPMEFDAGKMANMRVVEANDLFISYSEGKKLASYKNTPELMGRGLTSTGWSWGASFFDADNDGDDDLYVVNGMNEFALYASENAYYKDQEGHARNIVLPQSNKDSNVFFLNDNGQLLNASHRSGANLVGNSRAVVNLDMDGDGDLDMIMNNYHGDAVVYRNNTEQLANNWLKIRLVGDSEKGSNRDAIGARIITATPGGNRVWREIRGSEAYLTMHPKEQHIGIGQETTADIIVEWPNGEQSIHPAVGANQRYLINQASKSLIRH